MIIKLNLLREVKTYLPQCYYTVSKERFTIKSNFYINIEYVPLFVMNHIVFFLTNNNSNYYVFVCLCKIH